MHDSDNYKEELLKNHHSSQSLIKNIMIHILWGYKGDIGIIVMPLARMSDGKTQCTNIITIQRMRQVQ